MTNPTLIDNSTLQQHLTAINKAIATKNLCATILAFAEFGETLRQYFPEKGLEEIQKSLKCSKFEFEDIPVPDMWLPCVILNAKGVVYPDYIEPQRDEVGIALCDSLNKGINIFQFLLDDNVVKAAIDKVTEQSNSEQGYTKFETAFETAAFCIQQDVRPNTPIRLKFKSALAALGSFKAEISSPFDEAVGKVIISLKQNSQQYFSSENKNSSHTERFREACIRVLVALDSFMVKPLQRLDKHRQTKWQELTTTVKSVVAGLFNSKKSDSAYADTTELAAKDSPSINYKP